MKGKKTKLLERLKHTTESKAKNYPENWSPPSKSPKNRKQTEGLGAIPHTAYWRVMHTITNIVKENDNTNFKSLQATTIEK